MKNQTKEPCLFWKLGKEEPYKVSNENLLIFGNDNDDDLDVENYCRLFILLDIHLFLGCSLEFLFYSMFLYARAVVDFCKM